MRRCIEFPSSPSAIRSMQFSSNQQFEEFHCFNRVWDVWKNKISFMVGQPRRLELNSPPDDPPDLILHGSNSELAVEHTRFQPEPLGQAEHLARTQLAKTGTVVPSIVPGKRSKEEIIAEMTQIGSPRFEDVSASLQIWTERMIALIIRKTVKPNNFPHRMLLIEDRTIEHSRYLSEIAESLESWLAVAPPPLRQWIIVLGYFPNHKQYWSCWFHGGSDVRHSGVLV